MKSLKLILATLILFCLLSVSMIDLASAGPPARYDYYAVGNPGNVNVTPAGGYMVMGGSTDVDSAFEWFLNQANGGDIVIIRASGADGYNDYLYNLGNVDSVETIVFGNRKAAYDSFVLDTIYNADALFMAGGDQYDYLTYWKDTPVEDAIRTLLYNDVPVGGTSAGAAVMGEFIFSAENGSVYSDEALDNPYNRYMTLERDFFNTPYLYDVIIDTHFAQRDRMGRLVGFLARMVEDGWTDEAFGIGVDEQTAIVVDDAGYATVHGQNSVYFLRGGRAEICEPRTQLYYQDVNVQRLQAGDIFDLYTWLAQDGIEYNITADDGQLYGPQIY